MDLQIKGGIESLIGAAEVAHVLGISERHVARMAANGELPGCKIGKLWRFRASDIDRAITEKIKSKRSTEQEDEE